MSQWVQVQRGTRPLIVSFPHTGTDIPLDIEEQLVSPWIGRRVSARVRRTLLRGDTIYHDGAFTRTPAPGRPIGRLITPS